MSARLSLARQFINALPYVRALNMELQSLGEGVAELTMPYDPRMVGDITTGVMHGGAVFALMDTVCGAAVMSHSLTPISTATLDLRLEYFRAATPGQAFRAKAECYHVTRSVAFVRATAWDEDPARPVATATGVFTVDFAKEACK